jgi:hypothetical protein
MRKPSSEEAVGNAADIGEQPRRIDAQAFEGGATLGQDRDESRSGTLGDRADGVLAHKFSRETTGKPHMPGFVALDAMQDRGDGRLLPQNPT